MGRAGFDDGLAIFFDLDPSLQHGQVQLYAGPGFEAAYLSNEERQRIFDNDMLPYLRSGDFDGALAIALQRIDAAATPEHAAALQGSRQINAVVGLVGAPIVFLGLSGWAFFHWRRFGKDPVYLDDPSVLMPAPPPELTAAAGAVVMDGGTSRRALTTAMLDLASRGLISFRQESGVFGIHKKVGIDVSPARGDADVEAQRALNTRRPIGPAEELALRDLRSIGGTAEGAYIEPDDVPKFGEKVAGFDRALEAHVVARGWFAQKPSKVVTAWAVRGIVAIIVASIALVAGLSIPFSGLTLIGAAGIAGGIVVMLFARSMPAVTHVRRDDPGDARGLPADAPEDDGPGAIDAAGRLRGRTGLARHARPGHRVGNRPRAPARDRRRPEPEPRGRPAGAVGRRGPMVPDLVPGLERRLVRWVREPAGAAAASSRTRASPTSAG